jgi:8-oxo-dGTP diphosphatase
MQPADPHQPEPVAIRREYPLAPLVGVAAAVFNEQGEVLLVERGRPPSQGQWGLPGGLLDLGETLAEGAHREVREECGIEIEIVGLADVFEPIQRDEAGRVQYHFVVVDFWARYLAGQLAPADDAAAVAWVPLDQIDSLTMSNETRLVIHKAHQAWLNGSKVADGERSK